MTDIVVVGAGPAGLSAAINAVARGKTVQIFYLSDPLLSRGKTIDNHLGFEKISGSDLMSKFLNHAKSLNVVPKQGRVSNIMPFDGSFMVNFSGEIVTSKTVVLAMGVSTSGAIAGEEQFLGRGVSYCATCDGMLYRGKKAVVWGLSPDAVSEANFLNSVGVDVTFISAKKKSDDLNDAITFHKDSITKIEGDGKVSSIVTKDGVSLNTDAVFILRKSISPSTLISGLNVSDGFIVVNQKMSTNIDGLFAAGDCTGEPLQISNAVGEGLVAAQMAAKFIDNNIN